MGQKKAESIDVVSWIGSPQSTWVSRFRYHAPSKTMQIVFKNTGKGRGGKIGRLLSRILKLRRGETVNCQYRNIPPSVGRGMYSAASKGKYVWRHFYYRPYSIVGK